jgi:hypothetical protein
MSLIDDHELDLGKPTPINGLHRADLQRGVRSAPRVVGLHDAHVAGLDSVGYEPVKRLIYQRQLRYDECGAIAFGERSSRHVRAEDSFPKSSWGLDYDPPLSSQDRHFQQIQRVLLQRPQRK